MVSFPAFGEDLTDREASSLLLAMLNASLDAVVAIDSDGVIIEWNDAAEHIFGWTRDEAMGQPMHALIIPDKHVAAHIAGMARFKETGVPHVVGEQIEIEAKGRSGNVFDIDLAVASLVFREQQLFVARVRDISERKSYERQVRLVAKELDHRVKNVLAIVLSIARQTARRCDSADEFMESFEPRILAYKRTQDLITIGQSDGLFFRALLNVAFEPYPHNGLHMSGPDIFIPARPALTLGMIVHEMMTNAVKHGALSVDAGNVYVAWRVEDGFFRIDWREEGGPAPNGGGPGFGSALIKAGLVGEPAGTFRVDMPSTGFVGWVSIPLDRLGIAP